MGTFGMHGDFGFSSPNLMEAETNRDVIQRAAQFVVLADHTKWGGRGFTSFASLEDADVVITTDGISPDALKTLKSRVKDVRVASL
jgi:DeoR family glycerol-3-phosphate regulon repressor